MRCSSARWDRASPSGTTPTTGAPSCPASSWPSGPWPIAPVSPWESTPSSICELGECREGRKCRKRPEGREPGAFRGFAEWRSPPVSDVRERLLQATYDCVARWGLAKTTVEDAAREAGVSRATVYRYFPGGRDELIGAVVGWEFARFFLRLYDEVHDADTLEEVMERGLVFAHNAILGH